MTWFKADDKLWSNPKWLAAPARARALWITAGSYCADQLTDGIVSRSVLRLFASRTDDAEALVKVGLWERVDGGYRFHDWEHYQPTREQVRAERDAAKERQKAWRERRRNAVTNGVRHGVTNAGSNRTPTRPDPTSLSLPSQDTSPQTPAGLPPEGGERENDYTGHTPARQLAAALLGTDQDNALLDNLPRALKVNNVRSPAAWLRKAAANGDLEQILTEHSQERDAFANAIENPEPPEPGVPMPDELRSRRGSSSHPSIPSERKHP